LPPDFGTPGMGVNLWGASPLYENESLKVGRIPTVTPIDKVLADGNCGLIRGKEARVQTCEVTNRNPIEGRRGQASVPSNTKPYSFSHEGKWGACARKVHALIRGRLFRVPVSSARRERQGGMGRLMTCGQLTAEVVVLDLIRH
jgi:hypothetical protein